MSITVASTTVITEVQSLKWQIVGENDDTFYEPCRYEIVDESEKILEQYSSKEELMQAWDIVCSELKCSPYYVRLPKPCIKE